MAQTPSPSSPAPSGPVRSAPSGIREKLTPEQVALMRDWVECTDRPFRWIGRTLGIAPSTVSRYAAENGWTRPPAPPRPDRPRPGPEPSRPPGAALRRPADRRGQIVDRLWTLAERHAQVLESQPIERAGRALPPLARLTRTLGEMDPPTRPRSGPDDGIPDINAPRGRSLNELRDELRAHLERIEREEGHGWEVREWWFEDGAGI